MPPLDDIPQAARDVPLSATDPASPSWLRRSSILIGLTLLALTAGGSVAWYQATGSSASEEFAQPFEAMVNPPEGGETEPDATDLDRAVELAPSGSKLLLGHRAFDEAPEEELVALAANPSIRLRATAAAQFEAMLGAAAQDGIRLVPLSGFRSHAEQEVIFFNLKAERGQDLETRAEVSAPPGYSEHHTGYAIDVGDPAQPSTHFEEEFGNTAAYQWMETNAVRFGFELSFPPDNFQGVTFEPWHWRFIGDRNSLETFYSE